MAKGKAWSGTARCPKGSITGKEERQKGRFHAQMEGLMLKRKGFWQKLRIGAKM